MRYRRLNLDGDYTFGGGSQNYVSGKEAVQQSIRTRLLLWKLEWWENLQGGLPMREEILNSRDTTHADDIIRERVLDTPHVNNILFFESIFDPNTRIYTVNMVVNTDFGEVDVKEVIGRGI